MLPLEMSLLEMSVTRNDNAFCCECESRSRERDRQTTPTACVGVNEGASP